MLLLQRFLPPRELLLLLFDLGLAGLVLQDLVLLSLKFILPLFLHCLDMALELVLVFLHFAQVLGLLLEDAWQLLALEVLAAA